jgi:hypothetical protein
VAKPPLTVKQQREAKRAEKVAELKRKQQVAKRNRIIGTVAGSVLAAGVIAALITFVVTSGTPARDPDSIDVAGIQTFEDLPATHVEGTVDYATEYGTTPPVGGNHNAIWLNCGVYSEVQTSENAVHSLEHGAVWVTYDPAQVAGSDLETLIDSVPSTYMLVSPYEGLESPVVASAWGAQVALDGVDDERLQDFIEKYRMSADAPEPGAACTGALDGPGKVA